MTLLELSEPLFQYVCRINRSAQGGNYELALVQTEIKGFLTEAKNKALTANLADPWEKIELPLIFFCDFMIKTSPLPWAGEWKELAFERKEMAGDEKFFDLLDETLKDKSPSANDRLMVFYTCIGLGFTGWYTGQPEHLRRKMKEMAARLQAAGQFTDAQRICADAYEKVDLRDLIQPPGTKLMGIAIALVGLVVVFFAVYVVLYQDSARALKDDTQQIQANAEKSKEAAK